MNKLISLDLRSTDATDALKYIALQGNINISISKDVTGRVNLLLNDVPIRDVFDLILRSNELACPSLFVHVPPVLKQSIQQQARLVTAVIQRILA